MPARRVAVGLLAVAFAALLACRIPYGAAPPPTGRQQPPASKPASDPEFPYPEAKIL